MDVLSLFTTLIGIAGAAGGAAAWFAKSRGETILTLAKEETAYYKDLAERLKTDNALLITENKEKEVTIKRLIKELKEK